MPDFISIGAQSGGPEATLLAELKVPFVQALREHVSSTHCSAVDEYALVLRVDGSLDKFGPEGLTKLRFAKARRYITLDIQVPEPVWQPLSQQQAKEYLVRQVRDALAVCVRRLAKERYSIDEQSLWSEVSAASVKFLSANSDA